MELTFRAVAEAEPGPKWRRLFELFWPSYRAWFLSEGPERRPTYLACRTALKAHMPELMGAYERLVDLAGGGDLEARFLSLYCPASYLGACSQVAWLRERPLLIRNYDYAAALCDAAVLSTNWTKGHGGRVIAVSDCAWGALDGMNEAGLAVSLAFGGRRVMGEGFGIPLILRYILETCATAPEAVRVLERVPVHMAYNVTAVDRKGRSATVWVGPDRPAAVREERMATNHQDAIEWPEHAELTRTIERRRFLEERLDREGETGPSLAGAFLEAPLFRADYARGWGTLYTAIYSVASGEAQLRWRGSPEWRFSFERFEEKEQRVSYPEA